MTDKKPVWAQPKADAVKRIQAALRDVEEDLDLRRSELVTAALTALAQMTSGATKE
jgi:hypothetical protein